MAFTGDTSSGFLTQPGSADALRARLLIMELTFLDDEVTVEHAQVPIPCLGLHNALVFSGVHPCSEHSCMQETPGNSGARLLLGKVDVLLSCTHVADPVASLVQAQSFGHMHIQEFIEHADEFQASMHPSLLL